MTQVSESHNYLRMSTDNWIIVGLRVLVVWMSKTGWSCVWEWHLLPWFPRAPGAQCVVCLLPLLFLSFFKSHMNCSLLMTGIRYSSPLFFVALVSWIVYAQGIATFPELSLEYCHALPSWTSCRTKCLLCPSADWCCCASLWAVTWLSSHWGKRREDVVNAENQQACG